MTDLTDKAFATRAVHAGERAPHGDYTPVVAPIHPRWAFCTTASTSSTHLWHNARGYVYPRYGSPTVAAFETAMAVLEGVSSPCLCFGHGCATRALLTAA